MKTHYKNLIVTGLFLSSYPGGANETQLTQSTGQQPLQEPVQKPVEQKAPKSTKPQQKSASVPENVKSNQALAGESAVAKAKTPAGQKAVQAQKQQKQLQQAAKTALSKKQYSRAIILLEQLLSEGTNKQQEFALEFIGLARDKKGQKAMAKKHYQQFIRQYPKSKALQRVKLRLNNLIGIETLAQKRELKTTRQNSSLPGKSNHRGSLSSDYRKGILINDLGDSQDTLSLVNLDLDARGDIKLPGYNLGYKVSLGRYQDLLPHGDNTGNQIRYLNFSAKTDDNRYQLAFGRQRSRAKGIFGRFDGLVLSHEWQPGYQINFTAGFPVASSKVTRLDPERQFYSLSLDFKELWSGLDLSLFVFNQSINDLTDRRAIGGEFKYHQDTTSYYGLLDYDIYFKKLNALMLSGNHISETGQRVSWSVNYRKNPYIGTRNALIGQSADSMAELQNRFISDEEILDLALDRTLSSTTASLQFSQPINKQFDVGSSFTWMELSGAPESGGVAAISDSGSQYYLNLYLNGKNFYSPQDNNTLGVRYSSLAGSQVYSTYVSSRYRLDKKLSVSAKLRFDSRSYDNGNSQQNISPTLRLQYQSRQHYFYTDIGAIFYSNKSDLAPTQKSTVYYLYLGYRWFF